MGKRLKAIKEWLGYITRASWAFKSRKCAYCGNWRTSIELKIFTSGELLIDEWFCTFRHLHKYMEEGGKEGIE